MPTHESVPHVFSAQATAIYHGPHGVPAPSPLTVTAFTFLMSAETMPPDAVMAVTLPTLPLRFPVMFAAIPFVTARPAAPDSVTFPVTDSVEPRDTAPVRVVALLTVKALSVTVPLVVTAARLTVPLAVRVVTPTAPVFTAASVVVPVTPKVLPRLTAPDSVVVPLTVSSSASRPLHVPTLTKANPLPLVAAEVMLTPLPVAPDPLVNEAPAPVPFPRTVTAAVFDV